MSQVMIPQYNTELFKNIFTSKSGFLNEWKESDFYTSGLVDDSKIQLTYALLYARYGNSPISNLDKNQFKAKVWATIFQYAPSWQKELWIQNELRGLDATDVVAGGKAVYNKALHPGTTPSTSALTELQFIDEQNTTNYTKSKLEGLSILDSLLKTDVTSEYVDKFKNLFKHFVYDENPLLYISEVEEDEESN